MKQFFLSLLIFTSFISYAKIQVVPVLSLSEYELNTVNGNRGRARNSVTLTLPAHTQQLIYVISTYKTRQMPPQQAAKSLFALLQDCFSGNAADSARSMAIIGPSATECDIDLCLIGDNENRLLYLDGKPAAVIADYSRQHFAGGIISAVTEDFEEPVSFLLGFTNVYSKSLVLVSIEAAALVEVDDSLSKKVYTINEVVTTPQFPGDVSSFLSANLRYPSTARDLGVMGKVNVNFEIDENGAIRNAHVSKGADCQLDDEAIRVVNKMPNWIPGTANGKKVPVHYSLPITFLIEGY